MDQKYTSIEFRKWRFAWFLMKLCELQANKVDYERINEIQ